MPEGPSPASAAGAGPVTSKENDAVPVPVTADANVGGDGMKSTPAPTSAEVLAPIHRRSIPYQIFDLFFLKPKFKSHRYLGFLFLLQFFAEVYLYLTDYPRFLRSPLTVTVPLTGLIQALNAALTFRFLPRKEDPGFAAVADKSVLSYYTVRENSFYAMQLVWICCYLQLPLCWKSGVDDGPSTSVAYTIRELEPRHAQDERCWWGKFYESEVISSSPSNNSRTLLGSLSSSLEQTSLVGLSRCGSFWAGSTYFPSSQAEPQQTFLQLAYDKYVFQTGALTRFAPAFQYASRLFFFVLEPVFVFFVFYFRGVFWPVSRIRNAVKNAKNKSDKNLFKLTVSAYAIKVFYLFAKHFVSYFPNYLIFLGRLTSADRELLYGVQVLGAYACTISIFIHTLKFKGYIGPITAMVAYDIIIPFYLYLYWNMRTVLLVNWDLSLICGASLFLNLGPLKVWHAYQGGVAAVLVAVRLQVLLKASADEKMVY
mmetsp:Transcript_27793/g.70201  ORF Transcript_27793/g.70201 Transcript_27793/m.70201 type:complete len:483 (+) Transcript_27793:78-1526(+)|eukprot:CAMPEP_0178984586 /NCGR_PEP_ID=MMETSP0795-20121207/1690_1 /TAXON_ID=88552 /ORGANISM="Amoebophrya sp., Strain Ameob2" /LENGTH=482 /DNA_ID=CAMNT_0020675471 /DNA_START=48 /DNA_END=1496 /DNA_ORIENTATION=-